MSQGHDPAETLDDFIAEFPSAHLRALVIRLRIEMLSAAKALQGELLAEFWKLVDDLNALRATPPRLIG